MINILATSKILSASLRYAYQIFKTGLSLVGVTMVMHFQPAKRLSGSDVICAVVSEKICTTGYLHKSMQNVHSM